METKGPSDDFWQRMHTALDKGIASSRDLLGKAGDKAKDLGERGVVRFEIMQLESQIEKLTAKLGTRVFEVLSKEGQNTVSKGTAGVKELITEMEELAKRLSEKEAELHKMNSSGEKPGASAEK